MMVRRPAIGLATMILVLLAAAPAGAATPRVRVADLLADPAAHAQGEPIRVRGELVGDFGHRGDGIWTQLNDDSYATAPVLGGGPLTGANLGIGVRIPTALWQDVGTPGGYRHRGAIVDLVGVWRYHDPERAGESYLDVTGFGLVAAEQPLAEDVHWIHLGLGTLLLAGAGLLLVANRDKRGI